ncbi:MAG TPA: hypothetical protein VGN19_08585, partial [Pedococcus sp.]|nr:hypothetical protein [Pedococcus sp.]
WVLAAVVLGLLVAIPLIVRARRRGAWTAELTAAEAEVAWFARILAPQLRQAGSLDEVAGGWAVAAERVTGVEDRLTALEASAPDETGRLRALSLRDAVRTARARVVDLLAGAATAPETGTATTEAGPTGVADVPGAIASAMDEVAAGLEAALQAPAQTGWSETTAT